MCKILFMSLILLITLQATNDKKEILICKTDEYSEQTNTCITGFDNLGTEPEIENVTSYFKEHDLLYTCKDSSKYCAITFTFDDDYNMISKGICTNKLEENVACTDNYQCKSKRCIHDTRTAQTCKSVGLPANSNCFYDSDCQDDLACSKSQKKCIARSTLNSVCSDVKCASGLLCNIDSKCQKLFSIEPNLPSDNNLFCTTGRISDSKLCLNESALPILQLPTGSQFLECSTDDDCIYKYANGTLAEVGIKRCYYSSWTETPLKYCRYGGGEDKVIKSMRTYISKYSSDSFDMDSYAYKRLSDPIERIDFINPGTCSLDYYIKQEYGGSSFYTGWACLAIVLLMLL